MVTKRTLASLALALSTFLGAIAPAYAHHYEYLDRDPAQQPEVEEIAYTFWKWQTYSIYEEWDVYRRLIWEADDSVTEAYMEDAVDKYLDMLAINDLDWHDFFNATNETGYSIDLHVYGEPCQFSSGIACFAFDDYSTTRSQCPGVGRRHLYTWMHSRTGTTTTLS